MLSFLSLLLTSSLASAQQLKESSLFMKGFQVQETRLRLCSVGETWRDPSIIQQYRSNRLFGVVGISHRFHQFASIDVEAGYTRMDGNQGLTTLQLLPFTVGATALFGTSQVEPFAGVGASFVSFSMALASRIDPNFDCGDAAGALLVKVTLASLEARTLEGAVA